MASTLRYSGWSAALTTTLSRPVVRVASRTASAVAEAPSYIEALEISSPVSRVTKVCHSKRACSVPWAISGWYGV